MRLEPWLVAAVACALSGCLGPSAPAPTGTPPVAEIHCVSPCVRPIYTGAVLWEPMVTVDPKDARHIVASSHDLAPAGTPRTLWHWALAHVTFDGGATWTTTRMPGGPDGPPDHPLFRFNDMEDSVPAFLPDGTLLWSVLVLRVDAVQGVAGSISAAVMAVYRSTDGGRTFPDVTVLDAGNGGEIDTIAAGRRVAIADNDKNWITVAPDGTALLAWTINAQNSPDCPGACSRTVASSSTDGGRTWSPPATVYDGIASGAAPVIRRDGAWVIAFRETDRREVWVAVSTDHGASWARNVVDRSNKFPALAASVGPRGERLYLVHPDADAASRDGPQVVQLLWSDDGGLTWTAPHALDTLGLEGRKIPAIAATADGVVITYWHTEEDGAQLRAVGVRGDALTKDVVVTTIPGSPASTGDYMGLAPAPDGGVFAVWNAPRAGAFAIEGARLTLT